MLNDFWRMLDDAWGSEDPPAEQPEAPRELGPGEVDEDPQGTETNETDTAEDPYLQSQTGSDESASNPLETNAGEIASNKLAPRSELGQSAKQPACALVAAAPASASAAAVGVQPPHTPQADHMEVDAALKRTQILKRMRVLRHDGK